MAGMRLGLIGYPVGHSISPAIQGAALRAAGIDATYELWETPLEELRKRVESLRAGDVLGANVTVPHKLAVMEFVDEVSPLARRAGAVNTIVQRDGRLHGDNTDVHGFGTSLTVVCPEVAKRAALTLGAGGAARAVVLALEGLGNTTVTVANRGLERAGRLAADLAPTRFDVLPLDEGVLERELPKTELLINATAAGWHAGETPVPLRLLDLLPEGALVVDLTYRDTDLLLAARKLGLATLDGLPMLVYQGARAFELWTGREAPVDVMMDAARVARDARR